MPSFPGVISKSGGGSGGGTTPATVIKSITGAGRTGNPGALTQHGAWTVTDGEITSTQTVGDYTVSFTVDTTGLTITIKKTGNVKAYFRVSPQTTGYVWLKAQAYAALTNQTHVVYWNVYNGNPNSHISAKAVGAVCFDISTPAIWQATATGTAHWVNLNSLINTTVVSSNPSAANEFLVSTGTKAAGWTATPPGAKKINATAITGNPSAAGKVLTSTGTDAADWATPAGATKINATAITGNPSAASELLVSTGTDAAGWTATPPGSKKINTTAVTGNPSVAGKVLVSTASDAAHWTTAPAATATYKSGTLGSQVTYAATTPHTVFTITFTKTGKWILSASGACIPTSTTGTIILEIPSTTHGTATFSRLGGNSVAEFKAASTDVTTVELSINVLLTVSVAGTIIVKVLATKAGHIPASSSAGYYARYN